MLRAPVAVVWLGRVLWLACAVGPGPLRST